MNCRPTKLLEIINERFDQIPVLVNLLVEYSMHLRSYKARSKVMMAASSTSSGTRRAQAGRSSGGQKPKAPGRHGEAQLFRKSKARCRMTSSSGEVGSRRRLCSTSYVAKPLQSSSWWSRKSISDMNPPRLLDVWINALAKTHPFSKYYD